MVCKYCGNEVGPQDVFCTSCGQKIEYGMVGEKTKKKTGKAKTIAIIIVISLLLLFFIGRFIVNLTIAILGYSDDYEYDSGYITNSNVIVYSLVEEFGNDTYTGTLTLTKSGDNYKCTYEGVDFTGYYSNEIEVSGYLNLTKTVNGEKYYYSTMTGYSNYYWVMSEDGETVSYYLETFYRQH